MSVEFSFDVLATQGTNVLAPGHYTVNKFKERTGRDPKFEDLSTYEQDQYRTYLAFVNAATALMDSSNEVHVRLNHGARSGSIARVVNAGNIIVKKTGGHIFNGCPFEIARDLKIELIWDDNKTWKFDFHRSVDQRVLPTGTKRHEFLINYAGPTVKEFEKKEKVIEPAAILHDAYGQLIEVDSWVIDQSFKIGRVNRISPKGTLWIEFLAQNLGSKYASKGHVQQFGRSPRELLVMNVPEGFTTTTFIMDKDIRSFEIKPTFTFGYPE